MLKKNSFIDTSINAGVLALIGVIVIAFVLSIFYTAYKFNFLNIQDKNDYAIRAPLLPINNVPVNQKFMQEEILPILKMAIPPQSHLAGLLSLYGPGFEEDLLSIFAADYGFTLQAEEVNNFTEAYALLKAGKVDLIAGFSYDETAVLEKNIAVGPTYRFVNPVLLRGKSSPKNGSLVFSDPILFDSLSNFEFSGNFKNLPTEGEYQPSLPDVIGSISDGEASYALLDAQSLALVRPFFPNLQTTSKRLEQTSLHRWYWKNNNSFLDFSLSSFWEDTDTDSILAELDDKYYGFLPPGVRTEDLLHLSKTVGKELSSYYTAIAEAAKKNNLDPLLLTAVIFQESKFNSEAISHTGTKGLMQITDSTASYLGINPKNPYESIRGGAKYLREIWNSLENENLNFWDRWNYTLAAYNQGPGNLKEAIRLAKKIKNYRGSWRNLKTVYPMLQGNCRGHEAINFVDRVRYYYYVLNGLVILERPEAQHLAPLLTDLPLFFAGNRISRSAGFKHF